LIVILLIVLLLFGSKKLPELARGMGQAVKEFNKAKDEIERELSKTADVTVQPAPGQQPRQPAELPVAPPPGGASRAGPRGAGGASRWKRRMAQARRKRRLFLEGAGRLWALVACVIVLRGDARGARGMSRGRLSSPSYNLEDYFQAADFPDGTEKISKSPRRSRRKSG
jgi:sec-independent protein translocase protein TatA